MFHTLDTILPCDIQSKDTKSGRFYTTPGGSVYPSITTVLGAKEKPALVEWRQSLGEERAIAEMRRCADRGTAVHAMVEKYLQNHPDPTAGYLIEHVSEFKSLRLSLKNVNNILLQEGALFSDTLRVAGRVDCIAEYNGKLAIIDFKTSTNSKSQFMIEDYFMQTTAYAIMFGEMYDIHIEDVVIIMSVEKGLPLVFTKKIDPYIRPLCERINIFHTARE